MGILGAGLFPSLLMRVCGSPSGRSACGGRDDDEMSLA